METKALAMFLAYQQYLASTPIKEEPDNVRIVPMGEESFYDKWSETYEVFADLSFIDEYTEDDVVERSIDS